MNLPRLPNTARLPLEMITGSERPWGGFERFVHNQAVTVKIITVAPSQRLSLQSHAHRDELWQVIDGPADVEVEGQMNSVPMGGRTWVPRGCTHRLGNSGSAAVRVLEIAFGHFDEEDIERLADDYDRVSDQAQVGAAGSPETRPATSPATTPEPVGETARDLPRRLRTAPSDGPCTNIRDSHMTPSFRAACDHA